MQWPRGGQPEDFEVEKRKRKRVPATTEQNGLLTQHTPLPPCLLSLHTVQQSARGQGHALQLYKDRQEGNELSMHIGFVKCGLPSLLWWANQFTV